jgi:hypothetical protein
MKLSEVVAKVIPLAREVREYYDRELPRAFPDYPFISEEQENSIPAPPEQKELRALLEGLPLEQVLQLALLLDFGRMYFGPDKLAENYEAMRGYYRDPGPLLARLLDYPPLGDCLADALEFLAERGLDVDCLPLESCQPSHN